MTAIEWTHPPGYRGATWNPVVGCAKVSDGCKHCYAETMAVRLAAMGQENYKLATVGKRWSGKFVEVPDAIDKPLRVKAPTCWFVNSMSDLFGDGVSDEYIAAVFGVMAATPWHRYIVLTKRAKRMPLWVEWLEAMARAAGAMFSADDPGWRRGHLLMSAAIRRGVAAQSANCRGVPVRGVHATAADVWPLPNVIVGVSVEDQTTADERIPHLLQTPAACRVVSYEPALEAVDFQYASFNGADSLQSMAGISWLITGGESGRNARPLDLAWVRSAVAQCRAAGVAVFVKQLGANPILRDRYDVSAARFRELDAHGWDEHHGLPTLGDRKGSEPSEWPEDLRVREFPALLMDRVSP